MGCSFPIGYSQPPEGGEIAPGAAEGRIVWAGHGV